MKARELIKNSLFRWLGDWRVFCRLPGQTRIINEREYIPVRPIQPTLNQPASYIPADDEVILFKEKSLRLS